MFYCLYNLLWRFYLFFCLVLACLVHSFCNMQPAAVAADLPDVITVVVKQVN